MNYFKQYLDIFVLVGVTLSLAGMFALVSSIDLHEQHIGFNPVAAFGGGDGGDGPGGPGGGDGGGGDGGDGPGGPGGDCCGGGDTDGPDGPGDGPEGGNGPAPRPISCTSAITKTSLPAGGGSVTFSWTSQNAGDSTLWVSSAGSAAQSFANVPTNSGSRTQTVTKTTRFAIDFWNSNGGSIRCEKTVTVADPIPAPTCDLTLSVSTLGSAGGNVRVSWNNKDAVDFTLWKAPRSGGDAIIASGKAGGFNNPVTSGSVNTTVTETTDFKITVWNPTGDTSCTKTVTVTPPAPTPNPVCTLNLSTSQINAASGNVNVRWTNTNAVDFTLWKLEADGTKTVVGGGLQSGFNDPIASGNKNVSVDQTTTFQLDGWNGNNNPSRCTKTVTVTPPAPTPNPVCTLNLSTSQINAANGNVNVRWTNTNAVDFTLWKLEADGTETVVGGGRESGFNDPIASGNKNVTVTRTTTFQLDGWNGDGNPSRCTRTVTVTPPTPTPSPACTLNLSTSQINATSGSVNIRWTNTNAVDFTLWKLEADGTETVVGGGRESGFNDPIASGNKNITVDQTTTFQLDGWNGNGNPSQCVRTVTVMPPPPPTPSPTCDLFRADDDSLTAGESTVLRWQTTNATIVSINQGIGGVAVDGNRSVAPNVTTTYTLTAQNSAGTEVTCDEVIYVNEPPVDTAPICTSFTATPGAIVRGGSATLSWTTERATSVFINNGVGTQAANGSVTVSPQADTTYIATVRDADGDEVQCPVRVVTVSIPQAYTCENSVTFAANPGTITRGNSSTLTWSTQNVASLSFNQGISATGLSGNISVSPQNTTTYNLNAVFVDGTNASCPVTVTVNPGGNDPVPICTFNIAPNSFTNGTGGEVTLTWTTTNADAVTIDQGVGSVALDGSTTRTVSGLGTKTFTLTATKGSQSRTCTADVVVTNPPNEVPVCSMNANPTTIQKGGSSTLTWDTTRATSVSINQGIGAVALDDTRSVSPQTTTTYTLTATDADGDQVTCPVTITVTEQPPVLSCENNVNFTASPSSIDEGDASTLTWNTSQVTSLSFNQGISATSLSGSVTVSPNSDTTYVMTAVFTDGVTRTCPVTVNVDEDGGGGGGGGGGSSTPRCELDISKTKIKAGEQIKLTWDTTRATDLELSDDNDNVLVTTDGLSSTKRRDLYDGSLTLTPDRDTEYTLEVTRGSRDRTCKVKVDVQGDSVSFFEIRDQQPLVAGIALTQVPYTGFEAGPMLTLLFYALLTLWALFVAYVVVVKQGSIFGFSLPKGSARYVDASVESKQSESPVAAYVHAAVAAPVARLSSVADAPVNLPTASIPLSSTVLAADERTLTELEDRAHSHRVLISGDALRYFVAQCPKEVNRVAFLDRVIVEARASYPAEEGWVALSLERMQSMCIAAKHGTGAVATDTAAAIATAMASTVPAGAGSLAEAIATGNVTAAYQMIGNRPMIALADAAADLDAVYRIRKGTTASVSGLLQRATADYSDEQIQAAITALTGALDGVYTDEASAVKMAIMKAVKALA